MKASQETTLSGAEEMRLARESARALQESLPSGDTTVTITINGTRVEVPSSLISVLSSSLEMIGEGQSVAVVPVEQEIGTQEAAELLGVSRPFLVKLLDNGAIPSRKVGVQRRVRPADILDYKEQEQAERREVLRELAAEDQRLGLGE